MSRRLSPPIDMSMEDASEKMEYESTPSSTQSKDEPRGSPSVEWLVSFMKEYEQRVVLSNAKAFSQSTPKVSHIYSPYVAALTEPLTRSPTSSKPLSSLDDTNYSVLSWHDRIGDDRELPSSNSACEGCGKILKVVSQWYSITPRYGHRLIYCCGTQCMKRLCGKV